MDALHALALWSICLQFSQTRYPLVLVTLHGFMGLLGVLIMLLRSTNRFPRYVRTVREPILLYLCGLAISWIMDGVFIKKKVHLF